MTKGTVVESRSEMFKERLGGATSGVRSTLYRPVVEYTYRIDGNEYRSSQVNIGAKIATGSKERADALAAKYPAGSEIEVHYDPKDVSQAVLETGFSGGGCMVVLALGLLALAWFVAMHN